MSETLSVGEVLTGLERAVAAEFPGTLWVKGEVSGFRRTNRGAAFFKLVDTASPDRSIEVAGRGRVMSDIDRALASAGIGSLRSGIEVRLMATVGMRRGTSSVQLSIIEVDPTFTSGKLAMDRAAILTKLMADGTAAANGRLDVPMVPLAIGLVTSRGSAAHADFLDHLARPGYRFRVFTVETMMQGEGSPQQVVHGLERLSGEPLDVVVIVRGGGSKLDLATFDSEIVARKISSMPVPVITGIGHETDRSIADEVAAVSLKTPTAVAEWIVGKAAEFDGRIETARLAIRDQARAALQRMENTLDRMAAQTAGSKGLLVRQEETLRSISSGVRDAATSTVSRQNKLLDSFSQLVATVGLDRTLSRGFALVTRNDGSAVRTASSLVGGDKVAVRFSDGEAPMTVDEND